MELRCIVCWPFSCWLIDSRKKETPSLLAIPYSHRHHHSPLTSLRPPPSTVSNRPLVTNQGPSKAFISSFSSIEQNLAVSSSLFIATSLATVGHMQMYHHKASISSSFLVSLYVGIVNRSFYYELSKFYRFW